jgi:hypothetical protein
MAAAKKSQKSPSATLIAAAQSLPDVTVGVACAGTALEAKTFNVGKKAFLFVGPKDARLKLGPSLGEAGEWSAREPTAVRVGSSGWVTMRIDGSGGPDAGTLTRWVRESYGSFARPAASARPGVTRKARGQSA